ncbi:thiosulfate sulfurtransferase [Paenibacillus sp. J31TS4]|uniref:sulfurtransferase n=1 Tax=Paenibacillus sp. J31TS4 TaxID=2807195 RepID=UPI001B209335|nr:sulfurtransferase [Paenibacillus sp. J31TS4]GIP40323.1 thiosulfate sulfurtransferase [Paenibacillus sp. J31TS4]
MANVVSMEWIRDHLNDESLVLADCRFALGQPLSGRKDYEEGHLPGAVYVDLERDLSGPKAEHGGRHPLPSITELADVLGRAGIDGSKRVVAYDDQGGAMASRLWWILKYLGHDNVQIMDGGFGAWKREGYPVTLDVTELYATTFEPQPRSEMLLTMEEVKSRLGTPGLQLLDSREAKRYRGEEEAIDPVAGHIPGAANYFWKDSLTEQGTWKPAEQLRERFSSLSPDRETVVYCGSGVTACPNILALTEAGFRDIKLYGGSWSDWISYKENLIATGEE